MKRFFVALFAFCVLPFSAQKLFSQSEYSHSDTTWIYDFQSEADSTFQQVKFHAEYDSANVQITWLMISDEMDNGWQLGTRFRKMFNDQDLLSILVWSSWNASSGEWEENFLYKYFYDQWGNDTLYLISDKYGSDEWTPAHGNRYVNSYNGLDQLVQVVVYQGYPDQVSEYEKYEYTYDSVGNRILTIRYNFGTDWALNSSYEDSYDEEGRKVEEITYYRLGDAWEKGIRTVWSYDAYGNNSVLEASAWDQDPGEWRMYFRDDITYDLQGRPLLKINQESAAFGDPLITTRYEYYYNLSGKLALTVISLQDEGEGGYVLSQKEFTRYGGDYIIKQDSICSGETYHWEGEAIEDGGEYRKEYVSAMGLDSIHVLYLTLYECNTGIGELSGSSLLLYPIPVKDILHIQSELGEVQIEVIDPNGRMVVAGKGTAIDLSRFSDGLYVIRLKDLLGRPLGSRTIIKK